MSEMGEMFASMKEASQVKRANNRSSSLQILIDNGIAFESHNSGAHLIINRNGRIWDFWPGTGKWVERGINRYRRGVYRLLQAIPSRLNEVDREESYWRGEMLNGDVK